LDRQNRLVPPLQFEGKTQMDVVREIIEAFDSYDFVFLISPTGTGKSLIALATIYNAFSNGIVVVPTKHLQKQYYADYNPIDGKFRLPNLRINFILGRNNFICPYTGKRCDDPTLPCTRKLNEGERRFDVAKECPAWSPRYPKKLANKVKYVIGKDYSTYRTIDGEWAIFHSNNDCPYLRQYYEAYINSEVVVMNDRLWLIETLARRKPIWYRAIEVLDEIDHLLDRLVKGFTIRHSDIERFIDEETERKWRALMVMRHVEREDVFDVVFEIFRCLEKAMLNAERLYYKVNRIIEDFDELIYRIDPKEEKIYFFYKSPAKYVQQIFDMSNAKILGMSATLQNIKVLTDYFGFDKDSFTIIKGKTKFPGKIYLLKNKRWWISHKNWEKIKKDVIKETKKVVRKGVKLGYRVLVQAHAFKYVDELGLPIDDARHDYFDKWLKGEIKALASTRVKRGVDINKKYAPKLLVIPKFPLPDKESMQIKCLFETLPANLANAVYYDMARRDLIQQVGRVLRSDDDWAVVAIMDNLALKVLEKSKCWEIKRIGDLDGKEAVPLPKQG